MFLKLGLTSFGGPIAHVGYFRDAVVRQRQWVDDGQFGQLLTMCQFLPGPASSQLGFSLGLVRAGWLGALAAFLAFTLPSALLMVLCASAFPLLSGRLGMAAIHGTKLMAVAVVAHAVVGMATKLCPDRPRQTIALLAAIGMLFASSAWAQAVVMAAAAFAGVVFLRKVVAPPSSATIVVPYSRRNGSLLLLAFVALLIGLPLVATAEPHLASVAEAFYRAGALVFGGGHVVLPLLEESVVAPGWVQPDAFFAGYAGAQAIPGPMFAVTAYLGALLAPEGLTLIWAATALLFIFLPGFLLIAGLLPWWHVVSRAAPAHHAIAGMNAAVVGLLVAALYTPVFTSSVSTPGDMGIVFAAWSLLGLWRTPPIVVLGGCLAATVVPAWLAG